MSDTKTTAEQLRAAFDGMITQLQAARDAIDTPELFPAPATERNLAEGYRYLLGYLHGALERAMDDPLYPRFRRAIHPLNKATIDNADAVYLATEIDGQYSYTIRGKAEDTRHWRGESGSSSVRGLRAPSYVIFELASGYAGDSGSLAELMPGTRINTATLDSAKLQLADDGSFAILVAPEKPLGYSGNFLQSVRSSNGVEHIGRYLTCRQLFGDWANEELLDLEIIRHDSEQQPRPPLDPAGAVAMLGRVGEITNNQMRFWNQFYTQLLETYGKTEIGLSADGEPAFMPTNDMNKPNALGLATGGGQSTNIYSGGVYKLERDEFLLIESTVSVAPDYIGFHLSNLWGESLDFESYQSSLNAQQMFVGNDGVYRWIVGHSDPGYANWLDTSGLEHGYLTVRYTYPEQPPEEQWPTLSVEKLDLDAIKARLGERMLILRDSDRRQASAMRLKHVQRRYRCY